MMAFAADRAQLCPAARRGGERPGAAGDIARRDQRDEHAVDAVGVNRLRFGGQDETAREVRKVQRDRGIGGAALGIVPQPHVPGAGIARAVPPLDRQGRAVDRVERDDARRTPAKAKPGVGIVAVGGIAQQRMVERIDAVPDHPGQISFAHEQGIDAQGVRGGAGQRRHHRAREVDSPEPGIEPLDPVPVLPVAAGGKPEGHVRSFRVRIR